MFVKYRRDLQTLPPTFSALLEHKFRAAYISGHVWNNALVSSTDLPQTNKLGWVCTDDGY